MRICIVCAEVLHLEVALLHAHSYGSISPFLLAWYCAYVALMRLRVPPHSPYRNTRLVRTLIVIVLCCTTRHCTATVHRGAVLPCRCSVVLVHCTALYLPRGIVAQRSTTAAMYCHLASWHSAVLLLVCTANLNHGAEPYRCCTVLPQAWPAPQREGEQLHTNVLFKHLQVGGQSAVHVCSTCVQYSVQYMCSVLVCSTGVQYMCTVRVYSTVFSTCVQYMCAVHICSTCVQYMCAVNICSTCVQ